MKDFLLRIYLKLMLNNKTTCLVSNVSLNLIYTHFALISVYNRLSVIIHKNRRAWNGKKERKMRFPSIFCRLNPDDCLIRDKMEKRLRESRKMSICKLIKIPEGDSIKKLYICKVGMNRKRAQFVIFSSLWSNFEVKC